MASLTRILFKRDTILKREVIQASDLPSNKRQSVPVGTLLVIQSYGPPASNQDHYRLTFEKLQFKGFNSDWYAYSRDAEITQKALSAVTTVDAMVSKQTEKNLIKVPVDKTTIGNQQGFLKMVFNVDTVIKREPVDDSSVLNDQSKQVIPAGTELVLLTDKPDASNVVKLPIDRNHVKFALKDLEFKGFSKDWYAFTKHVGIQRIG